MSLSHAWGRGPRPLTLSSYSRCASGTSAQLLTSTVVPHLRLHLRLHSRRGDHAVPPDQDRPCIVDRPPLVVVVGVASAEEEETDSWERLGSGGDCLDRDHVRLYCYVYAGPSGAGGAPSLLPWTTSRACWAHPL